MAARSGVGPCDQRGWCERGTEPRPAHQLSRALQPTFFKQPRASALAACRFPPEEPRRCSTPCPIGEEAHGDSDLGRVSETVELRAGEFFAREFVDHSLPPEVPGTLEGFKEWLSAFRAAFA